jgi:hypothetical protein
MNDEITSEPLLPSYVYVLADPTQRPPTPESVFYVGMGTGNRVAHHWSEVRKLIGQEAAATHPKHQKMFEIAARDQEPLQIVIGRYETQAEARAVEATLINWVYGYDRLTNLNRGHNGRVVRPLGVWDHIEGIDIPRRAAADNQMRVVEADALWNSWQREKANSGTLAKRLYDFIQNKIAPDYEAELARDSLRVSQRFSGTRVTIFLDDPSNPTPMERRRIPNVLARIRKDGQTNNARLHLEFTKAEATDCKAIFPLGLIDGTDLVVEQPRDNQERYDMLVSVSLANTVDGLRKLEQAVRTGLGAAINNACQRVI